MHECSMIFHDVVHAGGRGDRGQKDLVGKKLVDDFNPVEGFLSQGTF